MSGWRHLSWQHSQVVRCERRIERSCRVSNRHDAPAGGFSLWLESELECDDERLLEAAIDHGVSFDPGRLFRTTARRGLAIRLCFSAVEAASIDEGVARLRRALLRVMR